ncbi:ankyrin repeat protein [Megavirus baoshan]|uniref:Ankyrin repeat protein n=1 Tax=Megavirus baoshan TaxID=2496520 RepID=A0A3Q8U8G8_9VIRU|nr:ankyrin repeat protein [Megavirus baoshan]AZL89634.1 ankyrin repeat protein [Megavirus baoshan]
MSLSNNYFNIFYIPNFIKNIVGNGYSYILGYIYKPIPSIENNIDYLQNSLCINCRHGNLEKVKELVNEGANVKARDNCAIRWASEYGHIDIIKYLISQGADITGSGSYAIVLASKYGHIDTVKYLVDQGIDVKILNNCAIRSAKKNNHNDIVEYLKTFYDYDPLTN